VRTLNLGDFDCRLQTRTAHWRLDTGLALALPAASTTVLLPLLFGRSPMLALSRRRSPLRVLFIAAATALAVTFASAAPRHRTPVWPAQSHSGKRMAAGCQGLRKRWLVGVQCSTRARHAPKSARANPETEARC
jgi:hypothetical protein